MWCKNMDNILEFKNVSKDFTGVRALIDVSMEIKRGEIHAIAGENGAGKSTLIKTCTGALSPTSGTIVINGKEFNHLTPLEAINNGVAVIYQEFNLIRELSIAENVFLGNRGKNKYIVNLKDKERKTTEIFDSLGIKIDPREQVKNLTVGYQQLVEIAKALSRDSKILIMDEPSAALTNKEIEVMFNTVHKLAESGVTILYITHRLDEIFGHTDRVSILRDGELIRTMNTQDTSRNELISLMVGRDLNEAYPEATNQLSDNVILEVSNLSGNKLKNVSFKVNQGEILGFGGLVGSGRTETAEVLFGLAKKDSGTITYRGKPYQPTKPNEAIKNGLALVPEDRKAQGVLLHLSVSDNIALPSIGAISKFTVINNFLEREIVNKYKEALRIKTPNIKQLVRNLSGGNQQKVVLAKWLAIDPDVILLDEPTRGIDVGAKQEIYNIMRGLIDEGKTIIMISSDMEELLGMSDRIIVFSEGHVAGELIKGEFSQHAVLEMASQERIQLSEGV